MCLSEQTQRRLERKTESALTILEQVHSIILNCVTVHEKGERWMCVDDVPAQAVKAAEKLRLIYVTRWNDGSYYAQLRD